MSEKLKGHLAAFFASVLFGLNIIVTKGLLSEEWISSLGATYMRIVVSALCFWVVSLFLPKEHVPLGDLVVIFVAALFGIVINQNAVITGLSLTTPIETGLLATLTPLFVMLLAALFLREPITMMKSGGIALGAIGAVLIVTSSRATSFAPDPLLGNIFIFISAFSYAIYLTLARSIISRYSSVTLMKWMFLFAALMSIPIGVEEVLSAPIFRGGATFEVWGKLFYLTVLATFVAYMLLAVSLRCIRPTTVSMYNYVQPLVAACLGVILGYDRLTWQAPVAALLIFGGVYLVTHSKSRADMEREASLNPMNEPKTK